MAKRIPLRDGRILLAPGIFIPGIGRIMRWKHLLGLIVLSNELNISLEGYALYTLGDWCLVRRQDIVHEYEDNAD